MITITKIYDKDEIQYFILNDGVKDYHWHCSQLLNLDETETLKNILVLIRKKEYPDIPNNLIQLDDVELWVLNHSNIEPIPWVSTWPEEISTPEKEIRTRYAKLMESVTTPYSQVERETWNIQLQEADAYLADNTIETPMLTALANARGITIDLLVAKIKENDILFRAVIGDLLGKQQAELDALV